jgi:hypothetical protein
MDLGVTQLASRTFSLRSFSACCSSSAAFFWAWAILLSMMFSWTSLFSLPLATWYF